MKQNSKKGKKVLIHAAAGGVGHFAVQIAKHLGAEVIGTASAANESFLKEIGVDHFINYSTQQIENVLRDVDVVLDPIGGDTTAKSLEVLKKDGTLISIVGGVKDNVKSIIEEKALNAKNYLVKSSGDDMQQLAQLLEQGILKPHISHRFEFEDMAAAHKQIESGRTRGKIIVKISIV